MSIHIRRIVSQDELTAVLELRHRVFCLEQGVPKREELDGRDGDAVHLVALSSASGHVLGTCRLLLAHEGRKRLFPKRTMQLSRLAVEPHARHRGIATALLRHANDEAAAARAQRIVLHAQTYAYDLYTADGYQSCGAPFVEAGIEHIAMEKHL